MSENQPVKLKVKEEEFLHLNAEQLVNILNPILRDKKMSVRKSIETYIESTYDKVTKKLLKIFFLTVSKKFIFLEII